MNKHLDRVHIVDLEVMGILGIKPEEQQFPQKIRVNATLWVDTRPAATSDAIDDAVNYRTITKAMIAHIETGRPFLVERLVQELADICFATDHRIEACRVRVEKPDALRYAQSVGISIYRERVDNPTRESATEGES